ncbi:energy transducer TonB [Parvularcula oceani]|uniref:energy transducer TonB n=1 Tax=Parvularcula oceani TaxID=1247963 RepID=UPI0004E12BC3|nr:energy transducer TonB [Parvularcula oceani]
MGSKGILAAAILVLSPQAAAQDYKAFYQDYLEATRDGDPAAAAAHAEKAWQAAEQELGSSDTTALLAQNLVDLLVWTEPGRALAPARRAMVLAKSGFGASNYDERDVAVLLALAEVGGEPDGRALKTATNTILEADPRPSYMLASAWLNIAELAILGRDKRIAERAADEAIRIMSGLRFAEAPDLAAAHFARGAAAMITNGRRNRRVADMHEAWIHFRETRALFEPADSPEAIPPLAAAAYVWMRTLGSLGGHPSKVDLERRGYDALSDLPPLLGDNEACHEAVEWEGDRQIEYPLTAQNMGRVGGVLFAYDIGTDGGLTNLRLIAEVPGRVFGQSVIEQAADWRVDPASVLPGCERGRIFTVQYSIGY